MAVKAAFWHGEPIMVDHTPTVAIVAGDVVVTNDTARIAHLDIAANALGALAARDGIYIVAGDAAIGENKKVYWNATAGQITETAGANKVFGLTVSACTGAAALCKARHDPAQ